MATSRATPASGGQIGANAYTLSGHGLVSRIEGAAALVLSAYRTHTPSTVRNPICMASAIVRATSHPQRPVAPVDALVDALVSASTARPAPQSTPTRVPTRGPTGAN
jgi:hypothetical protein